MLIRFVHVPVRWSLWVLPLLLILVLVGGCELRQSESEPVAMEKSNGHRSVKDLEATFVGSEACRECHEGVYRAWQTTFHAKKFQRANPFFITGDFEEHNTLDEGDTTTTMTREGDTFFVETKGPDGALHKYEVKYALGSIWKQRYLTEFPNGALYVLPVQWNVKTREWTSYRGPEHFGPEDNEFWASEKQIFQYECMGCHTTNAKVEHDAQSDTYETTWTEMGVGCEGCHGPGSLHVKSDLPDKFDTILNPPRVPDPRRAAMVCGACHDRGRSPDGKYAYPVDYMPGEELQFHLDAQPGQFPDGSPALHHQQYNDWKKSGHERAGVMCWDCHSPHVRGKFNRYQLKLPGSLLCNTCHTSIERRGVHGLHSVNNCIGCHMPNTVKSATPGDLRSHSFKVIRPEWTVESGGDVEEQPNSCNLCHYHEDYAPERLVHFLEGIRKPQPCRECHYHDTEDDLYNWDPTF